MDQVFLGFQIFLDSLHLISEGEISDLEGVGSTYILEGDGMSIACGDRRRFGKPVEESTKGSKGRSGIEKGWGGGIYPGGDRRSYPWRKCGIWKSGRWIDDGRDGSPISKGGIDDRWPDWWRIGWEWGKNGSRDRWIDGTWR